MAAKSTTRTRRRRPPQIVAYLKAKGIDPDTWPLSPHIATNRWYATFGRSRVYFGPLDGDPDEALKKYQHEAPHLSRGKTPPPRPEDGTKVHEIVNLWLDRQEIRMDRGKIKPATYSDYKRVAVFFAGVVGRDTPVASLTPDTWTDLRDAIDDKSKSPTVRSRYVVITRQIFGWAVDNLLIKTQPSYGDEFVVATKAEKRVAQHARGRQTFTAKELRTIIDDAPPLIRAVTMLAANTGMTQQDISDLRRRDVDLDEGLVDNLRGKSSMLRRAPLWAETLALLQPYLKGKRPEDRVFTHKDGTELVYFTDADPPQRRDRLQGRFTRILKRNGIELDRAGIGHIKHTVKGVVSAVNDPVAVDTVLGHEPGKGIDWHYIRTIERHRLDAVVQVMHDWLYPKAKKTRMKKGGTGKK